MEFQTLKKSYKKQIVIGALAVCVIGGALTFNLTRAKYKLTQDIPLVRGTINYKVPDMRVVAVNTSEDGTNYNIVDEIPTEGYNFNSEKSVCKVATETSGIENAPKDNNITIEYVNGKINILGVTKKGTRCYLYFDKYVPTASETILKNITINSEVPSFNTIATTDEGVFKIEDGMYGGYSYYWRGAVSNNYVKFGGFCWRIVRINGDGSMRLIYDGSSCHANGTSTLDSLITTNQKYYDSYDRSEYVGYTFTEENQRGKTVASNLKAQTDKWYNSNLANYASKIADGKYCNDRNVASGYSWSSQPSSTFYYAAKERLLQMPGLSCEVEDTYILKIGAITSDEVMLAGARFGTVNNNYYLYNGQYYWTMSPYSLLWNGKNRGATILYVGNTGHLRDSLASTDWGIRPVINLNPKVTFSGGNGTLNSPYIVI